MCAPPSRDLSEIVVTAVRQSDARTTQLVVAALTNDRYIFSDHLTVTTQKGVVRLEGMVRDLSDLLEILRVARQIAGKGRVVNALEYVPADDDGN